jgi:predicted hydrocarbon binding protein
LNERLDTLLKENLLSKVIRPIIFRGRGIQTAEDVDSVIQEAGEEYARKIREGEKNEENRN